MARIDVGTEITTSPKGDILKDSDGISQAVRDCLMNALLMSEEATKADGKKKFEYASLAVRLSELRSPDMTISLAVDELSELKRLCGSHFFPWVMFQIWNALEKTLPEEPVK